MMDGFRISVNDLAKACSHSADAAEWQEFVRRCAPPALLVALRVSRLWLSGPSPAICRIRLASEAASGKECCTQPRSIECRYER